VPVLVCLEEEAQGCLTQEQSSSSRTCCMSQEEGVCQQQHSMQITTSCPSLVWIRRTTSLIESHAQPHQAVPKPGCLNSTHVQV
jgi:hypothetical protein